MPGLSAKVFSIPEMQARGTWGLLDVKNVFYKWAMTPSSPLAGQENMHNHVSHIKDVYPWPFLESGIVNV